MKKKITPEMLLDLARRIEATAELTTDRVIAGAKDPKDKVVRLVISVQCHEDINVMMKTMISMGIDPEIYIEVMRIMLDGLQLTIQELKRTVGKEVE